MRDGYTVCWTGDLVDLHALRAEDNEAGALLMRDYGGGVAPWTVEEPEEEQKALAAEEHEGEEPITTGPALSDPVTAAVSKAVEAVLKQARAAERARVKEERKAKAKEKETQLGPVEAYPTLHYFLPSGVGGGGKVIAHEVEPGLVSPVFFDEELCRILVQRYRVEAGTSGGA